MMNNNINTKTITANNETFTYTDYNGISILVRDKDGYVNGTKMAKDNKKQKFARFIDSEKVAKFARFRGLDKNVLPLFYELKDGYTFEITGTYINPKLLNYVAEWINIEYAAKVANLMDLMNEKQHKLHLTAEENMKQEIEHLQDIINKQSVPAANCDKKLKIIKLDNGLYKLSADNKRKIEGTIRTYIFPASMNTKQLLKNLCKRYVFEDLEQMDKSIRDMNPKKIDIIE